MLICFHLRLAPQIVSSVKKNTSSCLYFIEACNVKTLCFTGWCTNFEIYFLLGFYAAYIGSLVLTFRLTLEDGTGKLS
jgi:hypothetical protein